MVANRRLREQLPEEERVTLECADTAHRQRLEKCRVCAAWTFPVEDVPTQGGML